MSREKVKSGTRNEVGNLAWIAVSDRIVQDSAMLLAQHLPMAVLCVLAFAADASSS
jgi:hypothetical protein